MNRGAIILCGGQSSRMGTDKALLPFGEETLLERTVRLVSKAVAPQHIVVVAAAEQPLPPLPAEVQIVRDQQPYAGPLAALIEGMQALNSAVPAAFVTGCDTPLLEPSVIDLLFDELGDSSAVVPQDAERLYPLTAVYKRDVLAEANQQLTTGRHSLHGLLEQVEIKRIPLETLRKFDPSLASFENLNSLADYEAALAGPIPEAADPYDNIPRNRHQLILAQGRLRERIRVLKQYRSWHIRLTTNHYLLATNLDPWTCIDLPPASSRRMTPRLLRRRGWARGTAGAAGGGYRIGDRPHAESRWADEAGGLRRENPGQAGNQSWQWAGPTIVSRRSTRVPHRPRRLGGDWIGFGCQENDVVIRANFCTLDAAGNITHRRAGRIPTEESAPAIKLREVSIPGVEDICRARERASVCRGFTRTGSEDSM